MNTDKRNHEKQKDRATINPVFFITGSQYRLSAFKIQLPYTTLIIHLAPQYAYRDKTGRFFQRVLQVVLREEGKTRC